MNEQPANRTQSEPAYALQMREYLDVARRRKMWILLIALGVSICVAVVARRMPNLYKAETVILVDPQKVPDSYVPTTVSTSISDRLSTIRQQVMSPTQLSQLIDELSLFSTLRGKVQEEDLILRMQKATTIEVIESGGQRSSAFRIAFSGSDPNQVAEVANRLASMFIERNVKARQQQFNGTAQFLDSELQDTKHELETKERLLQDVRSRYISDLPESKQFHVEALNSLRDQLRVSQNQVAQAKQSISYMDSMQTVNAPTIDLDASGAATSPFQSQIQKLETQLRELQERYGPDYPEVRKLRAQISQLKSKNTAEPAAAPVEEGPAVAARKPNRNPVLEAERSKLEADIEDQTKRQTGLQDQIQYHISKLERIPVFEQQIAGLMRDYDALRIHYNQLQEKKLSAEMASALETHEAGERFEVLDKAFPPAHPFAPKRQLIIGVGIFMGVFLGVAAAVLIEVTDESVRHEREAAQIFGKPVLAGIPRIVAEKERMWNRWRAASLLAATTVGSAALGVVVSRIMNLN